MKKLKQFFCIHRHEKVTATDGILYDKRIVACKKCGKALTIFASLLLLVNFSIAQITPGPSDTTSHPVGIKTICPGDSIKLKATNVDRGSKFTWLKLHYGLWESSPLNSSVYFELTTAPGLYSYQVMVKNSGGCTAISDVFSVYVLPALTKPIIK